MRFYFDFISPYAYLAWTQIHALAERTDTTVEPVPVLFAALLNQWGHKGPAEIPPKRLYLFKDVARRAHQYGVVVQPPPGHPFNPLLALRVTAAAPPDRRREVVDALFAASWGGDTPRGVDNPEVVAEILTRKGLASLLPAATTQTIKDAVRHNTQQAIEAGVFGVPTVVVGGELFWGTDSLPFLEDYLCGRDPVPADLLQRWRDLPSHSSRI